MEVRSPSVTVNGHVMGDQLGFVYVTPQWFDGSMLHSPTRRLAANVILQFDVLPPHSSSPLEATYCWC